MPTLTVRNVPESTVEALRTLARANGRSMEEELRQILAAKAADRLSVLHEIEESYGAQQRRPAADEVDAWIREGRR
jgi:plasmid stability protein